MRESWKRLAIGIAIPVGISLLRTGTLFTYRLAIVMIVYLIFMIWYTVWLTRNKNKWGTALRFGDTLTVERGDQPALVLIKDDIAYSRLYPATFVICPVESEGGPKRKLPIFVGAEGFTPENWARVQELAPAWVKERQP